MSRFIGYARISTDSQDLSLQISQLKAAGCSLTFSDKASGAKSHRPGLQKCLASLQPGDTFVITRLDRLGRSMLHLISLVASLKEQGIALKSLSDGLIDTTTATGELVFHLFSALAQFERELIRERTQVGLSAARARGRLGGRRPLSPDHPKIRTAKKMHQDHTLTIAEICSTLKISRATLYRYLKLGP